MGYKSSIELNEGLENREKERERERGVSRARYIDVYESSIGVLMHRYPPKQYSAPNCGKCHRISMFSVNYTLPQSFLIISHCTT